MKDTGTDWDRLAKMTDEEKYQNALSDPDNPPLDETEIHDFARLGDIPGATLMEKHKNLRRKRYKKLVSYVMTQMCWITSSPRAKATRP